MDFLSYAPTERPRHTARRGALRPLVAMLASALALTGCPPHGNVGDHCQTNSECMAALVCDPDSHQCATRQLEDVLGLDAHDAARDALDGGDARDAADARDAPDARDARDGGGLDASDADARQDDGGDADAPGDARDAAMCGVLPVMALTPGTPQMSTLPTGGSALDAPSCQPAAAGLEHVYAFTLTAPTLGIVLSTDNSATGIDTVLSLRASCDAMAREYACNDNNGLRPGSVVRALLPAGTAYAVLEQYGSSARGGPYRLDSWVYTPAPHALCASARVVSAASGATDQHLADGSGPSTLCRPLANGPQLFYRLTLAAGESRTITVQPTSPMVPWQPVLRVLDRCDATSCRDIAIAPGSGMPVVLTVSGPAADAGSASEVILAVSATEDPRVAAATFDLTVM